MRSADDLDRANAEVLNAAADPEDRYYNAKLCQWGKNGKMSGKRCPKKKIPSKKSKSRKSHKSHKSHKRAARKSRKSQKSRKSRKSHKSGSKKSVSK